MGITILNRPVVVSVRTRKLRPDAVQAPMGLANEEDGSGIDAQWPGNDPAYASFVPVHSNYEQVAAPRHACSMSFRTALPM